MPQVGSVAPTFHVFSGSEPSKPVTLADFKGKVIVVDFWATWCAPCRASLPHLQHLWDENKDKDFQIMAISNESTAKINGFEEQEKLTFPMYTDDLKEANTHCGITGFPTTFVVGKDGRVVYVTEGADPDGADPQLDDAVANALKQ